jgi:transposase
MPGASDQATLVSLGEAGRTEAHRRWLVLRAHLQDGVPLSRVAAQSGIPYRTLQRWLARYRADGLAGLGRAARADRGRSRFPEPLRLLVEGLPLRTPVPSAAQVHRQVTAVAEREGWPVPSYSAVYAVIRGIDPALRTLAVEGAKREATIRLALQSQADGTPPEDIADAVDPASCGLGGDDLEALGDLLRPETGIEIDDDDPRDQRIQEGRHRITAMRDAGVRRTVLLRSELSPAMSDPSSGAEQGAAQSAPSSVVVS